MGDPVALAKRLITKKGQPITLRAVAATAPADPTKPWKPGANVPTDQPAVGVFLGYAQQYIDGELVRMGDQQVFVPASGLAAAPEVSGLLLRGTEKWKIIAVKPLNPAGVPILYELQVRQ